VYRDKFLRSIAVPHKMRWLCASVFVCLYDEKKVWSLIVVIDVVAVCVCVCVFVFLLVCLLLFMGYIIYSYNTYNKMMHIYVAVVAVLY